MNLLFVILVNTVLCAEPVSAETDTAPAMQEANGELVATSSSPRFGEQLAQAKKQYFAGKHEQALALLETLHESLKGGATPKPALAEEALIYLGEIQFKLGNHEEAWLIFEQILRNNPDVSMSPYHHPTEVIAWFELVRRKVLQGQPQVTSEVALPMDPPPTWVYSPFGLPQFRNGEKNKGITYATLQGATAVASIGMYAHLKTLSANPDLSPSELRRIRWQRFGVQWPITTVFYALWAHSAVMGRRTWRDAQQPGMTARLAIAPAHGTSVALTVRF
jgi:tetratricopeptide (TPR) repeat protein